MYYNLDMLKRGVDMKIVVVDFDSSVVDIFEYDGSIKDYYEEVKGEYEDEDGEGYEVEYVESDDGDEIVISEWERVEFIYKEIKNSN